MFNTLRHSSFTKDGGTINVSTSDIVDNLILDGYYIINWETGSSSLMFMGIDHSGIHSNAFEVFDV